MNCRQFPALFSPSSLRSARRRFLAVLGIVWAAAASVRSAEPAPTFSPIAFGATGDGKTNDGPALQRAVDAAAAAGGGTVVVPAGRSFLCGSFQLKSHVTLRLDPGSRLVASLVRGDYTASELIWARGAENIAIEGTGTIEGQGEAFMISKRPYIYQPQAWRPKLVMLETSRHVHLTGFTLHDAPRFTVQLRGCDDVDIQGITIANNLEIPNCDGIDPVSSRNVRISGCTIQTGDDCVAVSSGSEGASLGPSENITVSHCTLTTQDSALKIGSGTEGNIRNVVFTDCVVNLALRGVDIMARDGGDIENFTARNITMHTHLFAQPWWGASEAVYITAIPRLADGRIGHVRHVHISGIVADGEAGVFVRGTPASPIEDVQLDGLTLDIAKLTSWPSRIDLRPAAGWRGPLEKGVIIAAFDLQDVKGITLRNCEVRWAPNPPPEFGPLIRTERVTGLQTENVHGTDAHPSSPGL
jgi:polygalacturonase